MEMFEGKLDKTAVSGETLNLGYRVTSYPYLADKATSEHTL